MTDETDTTTEPDETARPELRAVRDAAQHLADTVRAALATDLAGVARVQLPEIPRLVLPRFLMPRLDVEGPLEPDPRHVIVTVRTVPVVAEPSATHTYRDAQGLTWQTYGQEHDFSQDRMLEILNGQEEVVATYAPGTWLEVRYEQYADETAVTT